MIIYHSAVRHVQHVMRLWERDEEVSFDQAQAIVIQLIHAGLIDGAIDSSTGIPINPESHIEKQHAGVE